MTDQTKKRSRKDTKHKARRHAATPSARPCSPCCCVPLREACIIVGVWSLFFAIVELSLFGWQTAVIQFKKERLSSVANPFGSYDRDWPDRFPKFYKSPELNFYNAVFIIQIVHLVLDFFVLFASVCLIWGIHCNKTGLIWPWFISISLNILCSFGYCITWWSADGNKETPTALTIFQIIFAGINIYCIIVIIMGFIAIKRGQLKGRVYSLGTKPRLERPIVIDYNERVHPAPQKTPHVFDPNLTYYQDQYGNTFTNEGFINDGHNPVLVRTPLDSNLVTIATDPNHLDFRMDDDKHPPPDQSPYPLPDMPLPQPEGFETTFAAQISDTGSTRQLIDQNQPSFEAGDDLTTGAAHVGHPTIPKIPLDQLESPEPCANLPGDLLELTEITLAEDGQKTRKQKQKAEDTRNRRDPGDHGRRNRDRRSRDRKDKGRSHDRDRDRDGNRKHRHTRRHGNHGHEGSRDRGEGRSRSYSRHDRDGRERSHSHHRRHRSSDDDTGYHHKHHRRKGEGSEHGRRSRKSRHGHSKHTDAHHRHHSDQTATQDRSSQSDFSDSGSPASSPVRRSTVDTPAPTGASDPDSTRPIVTRPSSSEEPAAPGASHDFGSGTIPYAGQSIAVPQHIIIPAVKPGQEPKQRNIMINSEIKISMRKPGGPVYTPNIPNPPQ